MITLLVRCSYRPKGFARLYESILSQTYQDINIICSYDDERALSYIPESIQKVRVYKNEHRWGYDNYVNNLKSLVNEGYFMVIDEDDYISSPDALKRVWKELKGSNGLVCQFRRGERLKPSNEFIRLRVIRRTKIGMPCLILHHSFKDIAYLDGSVPAADYEWIKYVASQVRLKFVPVVVVQSDKRGHGIMEE